MCRAVLASTVMLLGWVVSCASAQGLSAAQRTELQPVLPAAISWYNEISEDPLPGLNSEQIKKLLEGKVVRIRRRAPAAETDPPERVTGYRIVSQPRARVWVAALDPNFQASELLTESRLGQNEDGHSLWHQYLTLPWPVTDRQWVIQVGPRTEISAASDMLIWEHSWDLAEDGPELARASIAGGDFGEITVEQGEKAIYVPANTGSWIMFQLEENVTLLAYRLITRVGGSIPDSWITGFAMTQLAGILDAVADHAATNSERYNPRENPIVGGDGVIVPGF